MQGTAIIIGNMIGGITAGGGGVIAPTFFIIGDGTIDGDNIIDESGNFLVSELAPVVFTGLLDTYPGAAAGYSLRSLSSTYTGFAIKVQDNVGGATLDVGFDSNRELDTSAIAAYGGVNDVFVETWYDQSGNGNNSTQATSANRPKIYDGTTGVVVINNGKPSLDFKAGDFMADTTWNGASTTYIFNVLQSNGLEALPRIGIDVGSVVEYYGLGINGNTGASSAGIGSLSQFSNGTSIGATRNDIWDALQSQSVLTVSGDFSTWTGGFGLTRSGQKMYTFGQEFIIYNSDQSTNRTGIETNINDFYSIYGPTPTPLLLNLYPNASAGYSLRKLNTSYTGFAIKVQDTVGGSTLDVGFDSNGELDTSAIISYGGSNDVFVETWYDQSGNSNNATQATSADRPKIYDGTTGVVITENGKPAVEFTSNSQILQSTSATAFTGVIENELYCVASYDTINVGNQYASGVQIGGATRGVMIGTNSSNAQIRYHSNATNFEVAVGGTIVAATQVLNGGTYDGTTRHARLNGASVGTNTDVGNTGTADLYFIGKHPSLQGGTSKRVQESIIYAAYSGNELGIETNINDFYSIY